MRKSAFALAAAVTIGITALASPSPAEARWRGGWGPGIAGGLIGAAVIGGLASSAYAYGPSYGYYGYPYAGGYAPAYYGDSPYPWGGYTTTYYSGYSPAYYGSSMYYYPVIEPTPGLVGAVPQPYEIVRVGGGIYYVSNGVFYQPINYGGLVWYRVVAAPGQ